MKVGYDKKKKHFTNINHIKEKHNYGQFLSSDTNSFYFTQSMKILEEEKKLRERERERERDCQAK